MQVGIRLHHPELRNCTYTLVHFGRPLRRRVDEPPFVCSVCHEVHQHKTYHLNLDQVGDVGVSETVHAQLKEAGLGDLVDLGVDRSPEAQRIEIPVVLDFRGRVHAFGSVKPARPHVVSREQGVLA